MNNGGEEVTKEDRANIERFVRLSKRKENITMYPKTIGAVVQMIYDLWKMIVLKEYGQ